MVCYFDQIPGLTRSGPRLGVTGRIGRLSRVEDFHKLKDFCYARRYLNERGLDNLEVKVGITGPITLGFTCGTTHLKGYRSVTDFELYEDLASALQPLMDELLRLGAYVQIDEPGLSAQFCDPAKATALINETVAELRHYERDSGRLSVHVCGDLTRTAKLFDLLASLDVDVLSLEFGGKSGERNLELLSTDAFLDSGKMVGFGCASVTPTSIDSIESVQEIVRLLHEGIEKVGFERLAYAHPNDGLGSTPLDVSEEILERIRVSVEQVSRPA